jgi:general stress protein YciG
VGGQRSEGKADFIGLPLSAEARKSGQEGYLLWNAFTLIHALTTPTMTNDTSNRGLGSPNVSQEKREEIARKGGETVSQDREHMAEIGRKGGETVSQDREHMAEIGRKGGQASGGGRKDEEEAA